ncbi:ATP-binding protein [Chryseolinea sp. T2]|uniref:ATP-binding protein n=1 Tax=Chryseolinea sp. T2 TaxID=3129255 RepID=UPI003076C549
MVSYTSYPISDRSFVAYAKREIHLLSSKGRFNENQVAEIDIIVSEMCTNLIKHGGGGEILVRLMQQDQDADLFEIICIDNGKGFDDAAKVMRDGFSTTQTLGHGLGSIARLSDTFQILSRPDWGTILYCCKHSSRVNDSIKRKVDIKAVCVAKHGETVCGDGYELKAKGSAIQVLFGDGLGHGPMAHEAVTEACSIFRNTHTDDPAEMIREMHRELRKSRGLVCSIASLDLKKNEWTVCGVGNIMSRIYSGITYKNYMSYNGVVGMNIPKSLNNSIVPAEKNQRLIMCSDGIRSGWDLSKYPAILRYDNAVIAASIHKDYSRKTDDTSVLVASIL